MKKLATNTVLCVQPLPQTIVSCRDKDGKNNALVVGFVANVSLDPVWSWSVSHLQDIRIIS